MFQFLPVQETLSAFWVTGQGNFERPHALRKVHVPLATFDPKLLRSVFIARTVSRAWSLGSAASTENDVAALQISARVAQLEGFAKHAERLHLDSAVSRKLTPRNIAMTTAISSPGILRVVVAKAARQRRARQLQISWRAASSAE